MVSLKRQLKQWTKQLAQAQAEAKKAGAADNKTTAAQVKPMNSSDDS